MTSISPSRRLGAVCCAVAFAAAACGSDSDDAISTDAEATTAPEETTTAPEASDTTVSEGTDATEDADTTVAVTDDAGDVNTLVGVEAAQWADNVEITVGSDTFTFVSDSLPSHELPDQFLIPSGAPGDPDADFVATDTSELMSPATIETEIPLNPVYSEEVTDTSLGQIGVIISGAQLFNDYEDMERSLVALDDQTIVDGVGFVDSCNGHTLASGADYHYHGIPYCITDVVDIADQHSTVLGFLRDGFPVYGNKDTDGVVITDADLDECSGHFGATPEFPEGIYHYHLTDDAAPYSIDCFHGVVDTSSDQGAGGGGGGGGDAAGPPPGEDGGDAGGPPAGGGGGGGGGGGDQMGPPPGEEE